jgi:hypothetical protein
MSRERALLYGLLRQRFTAVDQVRVTAICQEGPVDWSRVADVAVEEGVAPIVGVNLAQCAAVTATIPARVTTRLQQALFENVATKLRRRRQLADGVTLFQERGYDVLVLKSAALDAAGVYRHPWVTCARDVDLILRRTPGSAPALDEWAVRALSRDNGVECEINGHHDVSIYGLIDLPFDVMWRASTASALPDSPAQVVHHLCAEDLLITLCMNACRQRYFRLKALFDVAETVAHFPGVSWAVVEARARGAQASGIVFAALCAVDETIGLPTSTRQAYQRFVSPTRARVIRALVRATCDSDSYHWSGVLALRYAGFTNRQRFLSAQRSALQWPTRRGHASSQVAHAPRQGQ